VYLFLGRAIFVCALRTMADVQAAQIAATTPERVLNRQASIDAPLRRLFVQREGQRTPASPSAASCWNGMRSSDLAPDAACGRLRPAGVRRSRSERRGHSFSYVKPRSCSMPTAHVSAGTIFTPGLRPARTSASVSANGLPNSAASDEMAPLSATLHCMN